MQGVLTACLVLLLAAGASIAQVCRQRVRTRGAQRTQNTAVRTLNRAARAASAASSAVINSNMNCIFYNICDYDDNNNSPPDVDLDQCDCVPYYQCRQNVATRGLIVIRLNKGTVCDDVLEVCCEKQNQIVPSGGKAQPPYTAKLSPNLPTATPGCGQRNKGGVGFRVTGTDDGEAQFGEFPWMVALLEINNGVEKFIGGASLIHSQVVLTAAHTVASFKRDSFNLRVRVGEWDSQSEVEIFPYQQLEVTEVIVHEKYYSGGYYNDIALLVLRDPVQPAENVGTLCLPAQGATSTSSECVATGWGEDAFGNPRCHQVILKSILLPTVPRHECEPMIQKTKLGRRFRLHSSATCAGGEGGNDACKGYGGGPLACPIPGEEEFYEQGGIVSWGVGCGVVGVPGVYTDVAQFRDWVDEKFNERGLETDTYQRPIFK